jgi:predicted HicB family RNase H-like nuclease
MQNEYRTKNVERYATKRQRKSGAVTTWYQLQINHEILAEASKAAKEKNTDTNDYIIQCILEKLNSL